MTTSDAFTALKASCLRLRSAIQRTKVANVNSADLRNSAREIVQNYFREVRPSLEKLGCSAESISALDLCAQSLLRLSNGKNKRKSYLKALAEAAEQINVLEVEREMRLGRLNSAGPISDMDAHGNHEKLIIETLAKMIPTAALSYEQALRDLNDTKRVSYRGTANELRECLRETLDKLAPDDALLKSPGFQLEQGQKTPTQKQKVRFILKSRSLPKNAIRVPEDAVKLVDELVASLARSLYERSSISAHVGSSKAEVKRIKGYVDQVLAELLAFA